MIKHRLIYPLLALAITFSSCEKKDKGCTDPKADNFDLHADEDDGTCVYSKFLEGEFVFNGSKSGSSGSTSVKDTFTVIDLGGENYRLVGLAECNDIQVFTQNSTWKLLTSDCGIQSFSCSFSGANFIFMNFSRFDGSTNTSYSGQASKL